MLGPSGTVGIQASISQAVEVATTCPVFWYRGQPKTYGNLTPKVFRVETHCFTESEYFALFQEEARGIEATCPQRGDDIEWLHLMQHHGTPTRLLDWSESILVALYFAVISDMGVDAELWCMHPGELNKLSVGNNVIMSEDEPQVRGLARDAADRRERDMEVLPPSPVAFAPSLWFRRGVNQVSRFTIHPRPGPRSTIEETLDHPALVRYQIPGERKQKLKDDLYVLGIRPVTMFPDLDGLSRSIDCFVDRMNRGVVPCRVHPPACDGEIPDRSEGSP